MLSVLRPGVEQGSGCGRALCQHCLLGDPEPE